MRVRSAVAEKTKLLPRPTRGKRLKHAAPYGVMAAGLAAALLAVYAPIVFGGKTFVLRDALRFTLPSREYLAQSLSHGRLPEWWDGVGFGVAFAANPVHGVTSPVSWLLALGASGWALDALVLLQLFVMALGTFALARSFGAGRAGAYFSALALGTTGYVVSAIPNGNIPYFTWIPWLMWATLLLTTDRRGATRDSRLLAGLAFAAAFALQVLTGEPAHTITAGLLVVVVLFTSERPFRRVGSVIAASAAGVALSAVGVIPAILLLAQSARARIPAGNAYKWSMHPGRLLEWIWPLPFGSEGNESWLIGPFLHLPPGDPAFALSLYAGPPVVILALAAAKDRRVRRLLLASCGFLILAFGSYTPAYAFCQTIFPPLRFVNFPEKFVLGAVFLCCVAAGVGFSKVFELELPGGWPARVAGATAALLAIAAVLVYRNREALEGWLAPRAAGTDVGQGIKVSAAGAAVSAIGSLVFALAVVLRKRGWSVRALVLAFVGAFAPLLFALREVTPLVSRRLLEQRPRVIANLPRSPLAQTDVRPRIFVYPGPRIRPPLHTGTDIASDIHETLDTNVSARFGYDVIPGFETGDSARFRRFWEEVISPGMSFLAFTRLLGVDYAMVPDPDRFAPGFPVLARNSTWGVLGTFPVRPRAFLAPRSTPVVSADQGLRSLTWPGRESDPARVMVSGPGAEALDVRGPLEPCLVRSPRAEEVLLDCRSPAGGYAVLLDENLPGWSAELDGRPMPILTADGLFRAVRVGEGRHSIAFRYRTPGLRLGAIISTISLAAAIGLAGSMKKRG